MRMTRMLSRPRGAVMILAAGAMTALIGFAAIAVDLAFLMDVRSQLQNVADVTALAAASGLSVSNVEAIKQAEATARGLDYASRNQVLNQPMNLNPVTPPFEFGRWDTFSRTFQSGAIPTNSVRVRLSLSGATSPAIPPLFFAPIFGLTSAQVGTAATAVYNKRDPIRIMFVMDRSATMTGDPAGIQSPCQGQKEPLCDVKVASLKFLTAFEGITINGDGAGLVSFSNVGFDPAGILGQSSNRVSQPLTPNNSFPSLNSINQAVTNYGDGNLVPPDFLGTNIAAGVCYAQKELPDVGNTIPRVIVVLSDGKANHIPTSSDCSGSQVGGRGDPRFISYNPGSAQSAPGSVQPPAALDQAHLAKKLGIIVHTITFGKDARNLGPFPLGGPDACFTTSAVNPTNPKQFYDGACGDGLLKRMAQDTSPIGQHFIATTGDEVLKIFSDLFLQQGIALVE